MARQILRTALCVMVVLTLASAAQAQQNLSAEISPFEQVPAIVVNGEGQFSAIVNEDRTAVDYTLAYDETRGTVTQVHIHIAQKGVNGGVAAFLCSNLGNAPAGTPECPATPGEVTGTLTLDDVVTIPAQGFGGGPFALKRLIYAMRNGLAYVNVHTTQFPSGEMRGQVGVAPAGGESP